MISEIAYISLFGMPLIAYLGIATYIMLLVTAGIMIPIARGKLKLPANYHKRSAQITIILATIHGIFGISRYLGF